MITLKNKVSYNLNFLLYVNNIYLNAENEKGNFYPWFPITKDGLLDINVFLENGDKLWKEFSNSNLINNDIALWKKNRFNYSSLFSENEQGAQKLTVIKRSFLSWFENMGYRFVEMNGDRIVHFLYDKIISNNKQLNFADKDIYIETLYDRIPKQWSINKSNSRILYINVDEDIYSEKYIKNLTKRLSEK